MKRLSYLLCVLAAALSGCATPMANQPGLVHDAIREELKQATAAKPKVPTTDAVNTALLPPLQLENVAAAKAQEQRFDLAVQNAPASQVFMGIVSGTPYSMLISPEVSGTITLNLKNVNVKEALDSIRDLYGYEYRVQGKRIWIQPNTMQTRVFQVNYLAGRRQGATDTRLISNNVNSSSSNGSSNSSGTSNNAPSLPADNGSSSGGGGSRISTTIDSDFWKDLGAALTTIVGNSDGRSVILNPGSGVIVVRAMPGEIRNVENYLKATQLIIERQVMLEAKIIDVSLSDTYQSGINWASFNGVNNRATFGIVQPGTTLRPPPGVAVTQTSAVSVTGSVQELISSSGAILPGVGGALVTGAAAGFTGLAFQTKNFAALLNFLETQGTIHVLSSPRIATINNQKAVLKVGTDDFFVTSISTTTTTGTGATTSSPTVTLQPFFSGISLDVTPQIDESDHVILHVHPTISTVIEKTKTINTGNSGGNLVLPLASSSVNESDSIVRVEDGYIVAIGGLMKQSQSSDKSQLPGIGDAPVIGNLFGQRSKAYTKSELVILIKPTIIRGESSWEPDLLETQQRIEKFPK